MLVYGDSQEVVAPRPALERIAAELERLDARPPGLARHSATVQAFIALAGLTQGFADDEMTSRGFDDCSVSQTRLLHALRLVAADIDRSWSSGFAGRMRVDAAALRDLQEVTWPASVTVKRCEGYAFYALYPETYLDAARDLPADSVVIGLRSIGTGLAALVAAAAGTESIVTVRPSGQPFARSVVAGPTLQATIKKWAQRHFVIVDEGPGMSGSSFGGSADWLESLGVAGDRIIFMPSHAGDPGAHGSDAHRRRWMRTVKRVRSFEDAFASPSHRGSFHHWFGDITGDLIEAPADLSGGKWAAGHPGVATSPAREARKYLLTGSKGRYRVKFAGIDTAAQAKFTRARTLYQGGFGPEPLALRYGFLIERFVEGAPNDEVSVPRLIDYLRFRSRQFPAPRVGADLVQLLAMASHNLRLVDPDASAELDRRWSADRALALQACVEPAHVDARMHWWEWLQSDGGLLKTDAVDHSQAHDLVGCQDILWDVAGAIVELPSAASSRSELAEPFIAGAPARRDLLDLMTLCYLAFQMAWWATHATPAGTARSAFYRHELVAEISRQG